ncbi:MAG: leucine-rich repeat domain-containing protein [Ruminococcus sp.]|nr:leucine-rich repeat domain-containing protein [Ruminococcus sp.]
MKKIIFGAVAAVFLLMTAAFSALGAEKGELEYSIIGGEAVLIGFNGEPTELDIPDFIGCYPVTEVRDNAFYNCTSLKRITLPDSVTRIGHHCFYGCYSLESASLPEGLTEIGEGCFCGCTGLASAELPDTLEILPDSCFRACTSLTEIKLPHQLKSIGNFCFAGCTSLEVPETWCELLSVGERAFFMCDRLESIYIPPSCTSLGSQAVGYTCDGNMVLRQRALIIKGVNGSAAERYAEENGLRFYEMEAAEEDFSAAETDNKSEDDSLCGILTGAVILLILILSLLRIIFTDWSDQKLK